MQCYYNTINQALMIMAMFEFILHALAFFSSWNTYLGVKDNNLVVGVHETNSMHKNLAVHNNSSLHDDCTVYPVDISVDDNIPYGSNNMCAYCKQNLKYNNVSTYAYNGREFCTTHCRKRFSDGDLVSMECGLASIDEKKIHNNFPSFHAELILHGNRNVLHHI